MILHIYVPECVSVHMYVDVYGCVCAVVLVSGLVLWILVSEDNLQELVLPYHVASGVVRSGNKYLLPTEPSCWLQFEKKKIFYLRISCITTFSFFFLK